MKQRALLFSLAAGAACLALRLLQNHIGFEADTRLPVPGSLPALLLPLLLLLSAAALIFLPEGDGQPAAAAGRSGLTANSAGLCLPAGLR